MRRTFHRISLVVFPLPCSIGIWFFPLLAGFCFVFVPLWDDDQLVADGFMARKRAKPNSKTLGDAWHSTVPANSGKALDGLFWVEHSVKYVSIEFNKHINTSIYIYIHITVCIFTYMYIYIYKSYHIDCYVCNVGTCLPGNGNGLPNYGWLMTVCLRNWFEAYDCDLLGRLWPAVFTIFEWSVYHLFWDGQGIVAIPRHRPSSFTGWLPSGKLTVCYWTWPSRNSWFTHWKCWFSIVFCTFTRVMALYQL